MEIIFSFRGFTFNVVLENVYGNQFVGYLHTDLICGSMMRYRVECIKNSARRYKIFLGENNEHLNEGFFEVKSCSDIIHAFLTENNFIKKSDDKCFYRVLKVLGSTKVKVSRYTIDIDNIKENTFVMEIFDLVNMYNYYNLADTFKIISFDEVLSIVANKDII